MLHTAFAVATGAKKVHRLLNPQNFLTGSTQRVNSSLGYELTLHNSSVEHLGCLTEWEQLKIREKEGMQVVNFIDKAAVKLSEQNRYTFT